MKCLNCGCEIPEGKLYCENCGQEIYIVPSFEPEIEQNISDAQASVTDHFHKEEEERLFHRLKSKNIKLLLAAIFVVLFLCGIVIEVVLYVNRNSVSYQFSHAKSAMENGEYDNAIAYAGRVCELESTNIDARLLLALAAGRKGDDVLSLKTYLDVLSIDAENEEALDGAIGAYEKEGKIEDALALLLKTQNRELQTKYAKLMAPTPEFATQGGTYREVVDLKLSDETEGDIYFTLDGTTPSEKSIKYTAPVQLTDGLYEVKAIFINQYGIKSPVSSCKYEIILKEAHEPKINLDNGTYVSPQMITVSVPEGEVVHYTTDGKEPTTSSPIYKNPIPMPFGNSKFRFISIVDDTVCSEEVVRNYQFRFDSVTSKELAMIMLNDYLLKHGILASSTGALPNKEGNNLYYCDTAISMHNKSYYLIEEIYQDPSGALSKTGNYYCVGADNGQLYTASVDDSGHYSVVSIS